MNSSAVSGPAEPMTHRQVLEALSGLLLALFIATLSSTVVSTALPKMIGELHGSQAQYTWVVTATLLTATASTPIWGKLADLFSKKALVQGAIVVFVAGSVVAGLSQSAGQLIASRALQGIGVGGLQALVQIAIAAGAVLLTAGFAALSLIDHRTPLVPMSVAMLCVGAGVGMTMQNFVLAVQNAVPLRDIGAASSTVAFFRSLGGTIGVTVLGAVLARQVSGQINENLKAAGLPATGGGQGDGLNVDALPAPVQEIVRAAYGDATGYVFLISAGIAVLGIVAAALLRPVTLRTSLDLSDATEATTVAGVAADGAPAVDQVIVDRTPGDASARR